jgi:hypothetical protein
VQVEVIMKYDWRPQPSNRQYLTGATLPKVGPFRKFKKIETLADMLKLINSNGIKRMLGR